MIRRKRWQFARDTESISAGLVCVCTPVFDFAGDGGGGGGGSDGGHGSGDLKRLLIGLFWS